MRPSSNCTRLLGYRGYGGHREGADLDLAYALSLGLVFWVGDKIKDTYRQFGIDLERFQGNSGWLLPIPATLVVGQAGRVKARFVDPDFRHRMAIEDILRAIAGEDAAQAAEGGHAKLALSAAISV